ncbi:Bestrophin homolog [Gryllus bimaculatus]|nr:Bestrophin homolog [Gryllus bimaculatus]
MTVSYQYEVASSTSGGFTRLLFMWKGSLYKLIYRELLLLPRGLRPAQRSLQEHLQQRPAKDHALDRAVRERHRRARPHGAAHAHALPQPHAHPRAALHQLGREAPLPHARARRRGR